MTRICCESILLLALPLARDRIWGLASPCCRGLNEVLGTEDGLGALEEALVRSNDLLMKRKKRQRLIGDVDSTEDQAHGKQEQVKFNRHFGTTCFHPLFAFTSDGGCVGVKLRPGYVHLCVHVASAFPLARHYRAVFG